MVSLTLILSSQLSLGSQALRSHRKDIDYVLMVETQEACTHVKHHKKKIAFMLATMRHFAETLKACGFKVHYVQLTDPENTGTLTSEVMRISQALGVGRVVVTEPHDWKTLQCMKSWKDSAGLDVVMKKDSGFLCSRQQFTTWSEGKKQLRMEFFYREMRKSHNILMQGDKPEGGKWNFDADNRSPPKKGLAIPKPKVFQPDAITRDVIAMVEARFSDHFGDMMPFYFAVTREQALEVLAEFIKSRLSHFGTYQDAMLQNEPWMYHSHISFYLNAGLLEPMECIEASLAHFRQGKAPLHAVEGFVRQVLGWREFVRGLYWLKMPGYAEANYFGATRSLPSWYWTAETNMNCLKQVVLETKKHAYAHHIQRLMVLGNFALLAGIAPLDVNEWFLVVYADAYEWVELPNVTGMILFADGGYLASKPYAAGGAYIDKMSDYCKGCAFNPREKTGKTACPFNYLYWDFLQRNRERLRHNPRVAMMYRTYDKMDEAKKQAITTDSQAFLDAL